MRILFCGGGTAGHVYPNVAIAETFLKNNNRTKIAYVTTTNGIENKLVDYKKYQIDVIGLNNIFSLKGFKFVRLLIEAVKQSRRIINEFNPDVIIGTGGYATFPVVYAGHKLGKKIILHESNIEPGKTVKILEKKADKILVNFEESIKYFKNKEKIVRVGNPIRQGYFLTNKDEARKKLGIKEKFVILCFGGSLGALAINNAAFELISNFVKHREDVLLIWSTGKKDYSNVIMNINKKGLSRIKNIRIVEYINNMPETLMSADVVICRSGAMTLSEVSMCGKATVLIPSPNVTNNHQFKNAKVISDANSAILLTEDEIYKLTDTVKDLLDNEVLRKSFEKNIKKFAVTNANKLIYTEILKIL